MIFFVSKAFAFLNPFRFLVLIKTSCDVQDSIESKREVKPLPSETIVMPFCEVGHVTTSDTFVAFGVD